MAEKRENISCVIRWIWMIRDCSEQHFMVIIWDLFESWSYEKGSRNHILISPLLFGLFLAYLESIWAAGIKSFLQKCLKNTEKKIAIYLKLSFVRESLHCYVTLKGKLRGRWFKTINEHYGFDKSRFQEILRKRKETFIKDVYEKVRC